jgi:hypothetical protein
LPRERPGGDDNGLARDKEAKEGARLGGGDGEDQDIGDVCRKADEVQGKHAALPPPSPAIARKTEQRLRFIPRHWRKDVPVTTPASISSLILT